MSSEISGLSTSAQAGVGVGATVGGLAIIATVVFLFWRRSLNKRRAAQSELEGMVQVNMVSELDGQTLAQLDSQRRPAEMGDNQRHELR